MFAIKKPRSTGKTHATKKPRSTGKRHAIKKPRSTGKTRATETICSTDINNYPFTGLPNTRDLGGMCAADGRVVRSGLLLRSSTLDRATAADRVLLLEEWQLKTVVDFRNPVENEQEPYDQALFPGVQFEACSVLSLSALGVSREEVQGFSKAFAAFRKLLNPEKLMKNVYAAVLTDEVGIEAYRRFFQIALEPREGALLWHCTMGKDRAGLAAALLLYALGVEMSAIEADYVATNDYLRAFGQAENKRTLETYHLPGFMMPAVRIVNAVKVEYIRTAFQVVEQEYGSVNAYLEQALGVTTAVKEQLRDRYLEDEERP